MSEVLTKDQSIVTQVAAKIAADLVLAAKPLTVDEAVADWASATQTVYSVLAEMHGWQQIEAPIPVQRAVQNVVAQFPEAVVMTEEQAAAPAPTQTLKAAGSLRIAGKQHGPIPEWLYAAAAKDGVTEVWDNRDKLDSNPKRPHFKAVNGDQAYWPPRGR